MTPAFKLFLTLFLFTIGVSAAPLPPGALLPTAAADYLPHSSSLLTDETFFLDSLLTTTHLPSSSTPASTPAHLPPLPVVRSNSAPATSLSRFDSHTALQASQDIQEWRQQLLIADLRQRLHLSNLDSSARSGIHPPPNTPERPDKMLRSTTTASTSYWG